MNVSVKSHHQRCSLARTGKWQFAYHTRYLHKKLIFINYREKGLGGKRGKMPLSSHTRYHCFKTINNNMNHGIHDLFVLMQNERYSHYHIKLFSVTLKGCRSSEDDGENSYTKWQPDGLNRLSDYSNGP